MRIFGAESESQLLNMRVEQLYQRPNRRPVNLRRLLRDGELAFLEEEIRRLDGETRWVQIQVSVMTDADGKPRYFDGSIQDITERRRTALALRESERKLAILMTAYWERYCWMSYRFYRTPASPEWRCGDPQCPLR